VYAAPGADGSSSDLDIVGEVFFPGGRKPHGERTSKLRFCKGLRQSPPRKRPGFRGRSLQLLNFQGLRGAFTLPQTLAGGLRAQHFRNISANRLVLFRRGSR
jgi:hypothetical protein